MRITDIQTICLTVPIAEKDWLRWSGGCGKAVTVTLVQVSTDKGLTGLGDVYCGALAPEVVVALIGHYRPRLVGCDPLQIPRLTESMRSGSLFWGRSGIAVAAMSGIEIALWDIAGKASGLPLYRLLGGLAHDRLPLYASGGLDKPAEDLRREMEGYRREGFGAVKVRVGRGVKADVEKVRLCRETLGPDVTLMLDAVQGHHPEPWTASTAIEVACALGAFRPAWFEEPCGATDVGGYRRVRDAIGIPIAGGESCTSLAEFNSFFEKDALDIVQPDVTHAGGILACKKIAALAQSHGVRLVPHSWGSGVLLSATCHFAFSTSTCEMIEYPTWGLALRDELLSDPFRIENGVIYPPGQPGLGVKLTPEILEKYPYVPGSAVEIKNHAQSSGVFSR